MTQEGRAELAALEWVRRSVVGPAACITLVHSGGTSSVARGFGGRLERARRLTLSAAQDEFGDDPWVGVRTVGPWTLAVEVNGWQGSRPEVLDRLSSETRVLSVYWSVNGQAQFSHAADGRVLTAFNGTTSERRTGDDADALESMRAGLPWEDAGAGPVRTLRELTGARSIGELCALGGAAGWVTPSRQAHVRPVGGRGMREGAAVPRRRGAEGRRTLSRNRAVFEQVDLFRTDCAGPHDGTRWQAHRDDPGTDRGGTGASAQPHHHRDGGEAGGQPRDAVRPHARDRVSR